MGVAQLKEDYNYKNNVYKFPRKKLRNDGQEKQTVNNSRKGGCQKVFPFKTQEEISSMISFFENKADLVSATPTQKWIADRDKLMFILGINVGIRASDLLAIRWNNVYDSEGNFLEPDEDDEIEGEHRNSEIEEKKTHKIKNLIFNNMVRDIFEEYVINHDIDRSSTDYVFKSRQGNEHITVKQCSNTLKEAKTACGIKRRIASHSLRKTFALWQINAHNDDSNFSNQLKDLLNHSSEEVTLKYCGLSNDRLKKYHDDVQLGKVSKIRDLNKIEINYDTTQLIDKNDMQYLVKQLSERCYTCENSNCDTCYNMLLAKKYGYDLNII
jgi:integrase